MMVTCQGQVSEDQVTFLQQYKQGPQDIDLSNEQLVSVMGYNLRKFLPDSDTPEDAQLKIELTYEEQIMAAQIEDLSEEMEADARKELRKNKSSDQGLMFVDLQNLSGFSQFM